MATTTTPARGFSLKEAAALAGVPEPAVRKAIEARTIRPRTIRVGRATRYAFHARHLFYLALVHEFPVPLTPTDKRDLWDLIGDHAPSAGHWHRGERDVVAAHGDVVLRVDVGPLRARLVERLCTFRLGRRRIVSDPAILAGEPVYQGTRIPLAHITGLVRRGVPFAEIREDYPALSEADLVYAALVARMKANPGRPRKTLTLLRSDPPAGAATARPHAAAH